MSEAPIGLMDSGAGGLSIYRAVRQLLPSENVIYIADSEFAPYGSQASQLVAQRVHRIADYFVTRGVKAIVIACNTATGIAVNQLRNELSIPVIAVEPAIKPAALITKTGNVGVLATRNTVSSASVQSLVDRYGKNQQFYLQACDGLMERVESGRWQASETRELLNNWLLPMKQAGVDTLVLGCTHYPFVSELIRSIMGDHVHLLDPSQAVARQLCKVLETQALSAKEGKPGAITLFSTKPSEVQTEVFSRLLETPVTVEKVVL